MTHEEKKINQDEAIKKLHGIKEKTEQTLRALMVVGGDTTLSDSEKFDKVVSLIEDMASYEPKGDSDE